MLFLIFFLVFLGGSGTGTVAEIPLPPPVTPSLPMR